MGCTTLWSRLLCFVSTSSVTVTWKHHHTLIQNDVWPSVWAPTSDPIEMTYKTNHHSNMYIKYQIRVDFGWPSSKRCDYLIQDQGPKHSFPQCLSLGSLGTECETNTWVQGVSLRVLSQRIGEQNGRSETQEDKNQFKPVLRSRPPL